MAQISIQVRKSLMMIEDARYENGGRTDFYLAQPSRFGGYSNLSDWVKRVRATADAADCPVWWSHDEFLVLDHWKHEFML